MESGPHLPSVRPEHHDLYLVGGVAATWVPTMCLTHVDKAYSLISPLPVLRREKTQPQKKQKGAVFGGHMPCEVRVPRGRAACPVARAVLRAVRTL